MTTSANILRMSEDKVAADSRLGADLGMESLDFVDLQFQLETKYGVEFFQGSSVEKIEEVLGSEPIAVDGKMTEFGSRVFRLRLPEVSGDRLASGQPIAGLEAEYTSNTWVRVVREILSARPGECPNCKGTEMSTVRPSIVVCDGCDQEIECPTGETVLETWGKAARGQLQELQGAE